MNLGCTGLVLAGYFVHFLAMYLQCSSPGHHPLSPVQAHPDREAAPPWPMSRHTFVSSTSPPLKISNAQGQACECLPPGSQHQVASYSTVFPPGFRPVQISTTLHVRLSTHSIPIPRPHGATNSSFCKQRTFVVCLSSSSLTIQILSTQGSSKRGQCSMEGSTQKAARLCHGFGGVCLWDPRELLDTMKVCLLCSLHSFF